MTDIRKLRELAEKATKGPWWHRYKDKSGDDTVVTYEGELARAVAVTQWGCGCCSDVPDEEQIGTAAFIAAANPSAITALLDRLERAEDLLVQCQERLDGGSKSDELYCAINAYVLAQIPESEDGGRGE